LPDPHQPAYVEPVISRQTVQAQGTDGTLFVRTKADQFAAAGSGPDLPINQDRLGTMADAQEEANALMNAAAQQGLPYTTPDYVDNSAEQTAGYRQAIPSNPMQYPGGGAEAGAQPEFVFPSPGAAAFGDAGVGDWGLPSAPEGAFDPGLALTAASSKTQKNASKAAKSQSGSSLHPKILRAQDMLVSFQ
jgi:hypothetical protein